MRKLCQRNNNNAEKAGIRTAMVVVRFDKGDEHAINAFKTTDKELVYVDCPGVSPFPQVKPSSMDTTVSLKLGKTYTRRFISSIVGSDYYFLIGTDIVTDIAIYW